MSITNFSKSSKGTGRQWKLVRFVSLCCTLVPLLCFSSQGDLDVQPGLDTYKIQFSNVALSELVKFVSRITGKNFVYPESELSAKVTFVSDSPATPEEIFNLLIQILKVNRFETLEQDNNLLIFPLGSIAAAPDKVLDHNDSAKKCSSSVVTKVFKLQFADIKKIKEIVSKTLGQGALVETIDDANCIIVKDATSNIEKVEHLIAGIDREEFDLGIGSYKVQNVPIETVKTISIDVLKPIIKSIDFSLSTNPTTNEIIFVAPKAMLPKIQGVLEKVDSYVEIKDIKEQEQDAGLFIKSLIENFQKSIEQRIAISTSKAEDIKTQISLNDSHINELKVSLEEKRSAFTKALEDLEKKAIDENLGQEKYEEKKEKINKEMDTISKGIEQSILSLIDVNLSLKNKLDDINKNVSIGSEQVAKIKNEPVDLVKEEKKHLSDTVEVFSYKVENSDGNSLIKDLKTMAQNLMFSQIDNTKIVRALETIQWIESSSQILFCCDKSTQSKIEDLIKLIDKPVKQVLVELLLVDTSIENSLQFGVDAGIVLHNASNVLNAFGSSMPATQSFGSSIKDSHDKFYSSTETTSKENSSWISPSSGFSSGVIGKLITYNGEIFATLGSLVHALNSDGNVNIVMNPKIVSEEKKSAELFVGETTRVKVNVQQSTASPSVIVSGFELRDVGSKIKVIPRINNNASITLDIDQEISENIASAAASDASALVPLSKTTRTKTSVVVPNRGFVILSGMTHEKTSETKASVPILGSIPVISFLFSKKTKSKDKRNMMIFIRAQIIDSHDEANKLSDIAKNILKKNKIIPSEFEKTIGIFSPPSV